VGFRYIHGIIRQIKHFQSQPFSLEPIPVVQEYLTSLKYLPENQLYVESTKREARKKQNSGNAIASHNTLAPTITVVAASSSGSTRATSASPPPVSVSHKGVAHRAATVSGATTAATSKRASILPRSSMDDKGTSPDRVSSPPLSRSCSPDVSSNEDDSINDMEDSASDKADDANARIHALNRKSNSWIARDTIQTPSLIKIKRSPRRNSSPTNKSGDGSSGTANVSGMV
jgi:hypothetical protein